MHYPYLKEMRNVLGKFSPYFALPWYLAYSRRSAFVGYVSDPFFSYAITCFLIWVDILCLVPEDR